MLKRKLTSAVAIAAALAVLASSASAQGTGSPLTRFLDGLFNDDSPEQTDVGGGTRHEKVDVPPQAASDGTQQEAGQHEVLRQPKAHQSVPAARPRIAVPDKKPSEKRDPAPAKTVAEPTRTAPSRPATAARTPIQAPTQHAVTAAAAPTSIPDTPAAALDRLNAHFNGIDQMTATFVQSTDGGQRMEGTMALKRPGQLHFAFAPPSSLEIVSDGRNVAIRDKKLGTNDVYPVGQTPLKFLVQEQFDLARDTRVRDVRTSQDGIVTVTFDDGATFGGTSKIELRFDARANRLKQWTVTDPQGFRTTVVLSNVDVVQRQGT